MTSPASSTSSTISSGQHSAWPHRSGSHALARRVGASWPMTPPTPVAATPTATIAAGTSTCTDRGSTPPGSSPTNRSPWPWGHRRQRGVGVQRCQQHGAPRRRAGQLRLQKGPTILRVAAQRQQVLLLPGPRRSRQLRLRERRAPRRRRRAADEARWPLDAAS
uniref:Uncharacterized protein n=1 Tax=Triticum urartu TaxID=4572 RepID=A0A8R7UX98_TRIUA